jgi:hypothetical protein
MNSYSLNIKRKIKMEGYSSKELAEFLEIDIENYSRNANLQIKIFKKNKYLENEISKEIEKRQLILEQLKSKLIFCYINHYHKNINK